MNKIFKTGIVFTFSALLSLPVAAKVTLPAVNLGASSFMDGVAGPGFLLQETLSTYNIDSFQGPLGQSVPGNNKATLNVAMTHFAYISPKKILGGFYGAEILLPVVNYDFNTDIGMNTSDTKIGDVTVSPLIIQWMGDDFLGMKYWHRFNLSIKLPTGSYNEHRSVNIGNNFVSVNPHYAFTLEVTPKIEFSGRIHYLWNGKNTEPSNDDAIKTAQAGQAFHLNFSTSYALSDEFRIGVAGYYLKQITDLQINSVDLVGSKEKVFAIGPGIFYRKGKHFIYLNSYFESGVENRTEGNKVVLRFSRIF